MIEDKIYADFCEMFRPVLMNLGDVERGERVRKLDALPFDYAFNREGTVVHSGDYRAIAWDGHRAAFQYPLETKVVLVRDHDQLVAKFKDEQAEKLAKRRSRDES